MEGDRRELSVEQAEAILRDLAGFITPNASPRPAGQREPSLTEHFRALVEQLPAVVFMAYLDRGISEAYVSPQIERMLGYTQAEWLNDPIGLYQRIHPDDRLRWSREAAEMVISDKPLRAVYRVLARDGRVIWFQCEARIVRASDGSPWFLQGVAFDITDLKRAEEALRSNEQMLHGLFDSAPDTLLLVDSRGDIVRVSAQVERMFGYRPDELKGKPVEILMPARFRKTHVGDRKRYAAEPHTRQMGADLDLYGRRKNGAEFPIDIMLSPMNTAQGVLVIAIVRDLTRRKQADEALRRSREELRKLTAHLLTAQDEERRRIARELHDSTAQNLTALSMNLSLLLNTSALGSDHLSRKKLSETLDLSQQCTREVRSLSYLLHPPLLDELGLASALRSYVSGFSERTGIEIELELPETLGRLTREVETALFRITQEALSNVHRHSGSPTASVVLTRHADSIELRVTDHGVGGATATAAGYIRFGVGIPGMRERAKQLGGTLDITSDSSGTEVHVILPLGDQSR